MEHKVFERNGVRVVVPIPHSYKDVITLIQSDYFRYRGEIKPIFKIFRQTLVMGGAVTLLFWFRVSQYRRGWLYYFAKYKLKKASVRYGLQLPSTTRVGYGLLIQHSLGLVVNPDTIIGNNVTIDKFVNIGTNKKDAAIIGDCTFICPMTCVVDDVTVGRNVTIGAGAVVNKDIPDNATAVGVPAKVINFNNPARYIGHKWPIPELEI